MAPLPHRGHRRLPLQSHLPVVPKPQMAHAAAAAAHLPATAERAEPRGQRHRFHRAPQHWVRNIGHGGKLGIEARGTPGATGEGSAFGAGATAFEAASADGDRCCCERPSHIRSYPFPSQLLPDAQRKKLGSWLSHSLKSSTSHAAPRGRGAILRRTSS